VEAAARPGTALAAPDGVRAAAATWTAWTQANGLGEHVGLGATGAAAAGLALALAPDRAGPGGQIAFAVGVVALGAVEGLIVGSAQAWVLRRPGAGPAAAHAARVSPATGARGERAGRATTP
jgi:hypothetical protein